MNTDQINFRCLGFQFYNLAKLAAALPSGTIGDLEHHGLEISVMPSGDRNACKISPVKGHILDLDLIKVPQDALDFGKKEFDGFEARMLMYENGNYYIFKIHPEE
jgi:hypothetical protein